MVTITLFPWANSVSEEYASNFTDINEKISIAAKELGITEREVADKFIKAYMDDVYSYGCGDIDYRPRVIEHLDDIFTFIQKLIEKDYATDKNRKDMSELVMQFRQPEIRKKHWKEV